jgi:hypothetical protein
LNSFSSITLAAGMLLAATVSAQGLYRCGNTFSDQPCGPGAKVLVAPTETQRPPVKPADIPPSSEQIAANAATCERQTRSLLKDPESARIKDISRAGTALQYRSGKNFYGIDYRMNVNAKNSYGGYVGEKLYACVFALDEKTWLFSQEIGPWAQ